MSDSPDILEMDDWSARRFRRHIGGEGRRSRTLPRHGHLRVPIRSEVTVGVPRASVRLLPPVVHGRLFWRRRNHSQRRTWLVAGPSAAVVAPVVEVVEDAAYWLLWRLLVRG